MIYDYHPRFAGTKCLYRPHQEQVEGGDVLLLAPSVIAVGVGVRTTAAGVERLARRVFDGGLAHTVLAVPTDQREAGHLDTICTVIDVDAVLMHPALAFTLVAHTITPRPDGLRVSRPQPFLEAAAQAMGIGQLRVIETGLDPLSAPRRQWDDAGNAMALGRGLTVCYERNVETNARLEAVGVEVIRVPGSELASSRGGPRSMCCPVTRDPVVGLHPDEPVRRPEPIVALSPAPSGSAGGGPAATHPDLAAPDERRDEQLAPAGSARR